MSSMAPSRATSSIGGRDIYGQRTPAEPQYVVNVEGGLPPPRQHSQRPPYDSTIY